MNETKNETKKLGPLESLQLLKHCEMCGARGAGARLEPAFSPSWIARTLCRDCRIGSAELNAEARENILAELQALQE
jgi:hypothetical protein